MGLHIKPMGCNGLCGSCYENRIRSVDLDTSYDIEAIIKTIDTEHAKIPEGEKMGGTSLHGGEPLLMKFEDVERLLEKFHTLTGNSNVQTNAILITDEHIELFKKYKTSVGVSIDGDTAQLNYGRWNGGNLTMKQIQEMTDKTLYNMKKVHDAGLGLSIIALLRKYNADKEHLPDFAKFLLRMKEEFGIVHVRTNEVIVYEESRKAEEELSSEDMGTAFCTLADMVLDDPELNWLPYRDVINMMFGYINSTTCTFAECDIWKTGAETSIHSDGSLGSCLKGGAALDGLQILRAEDNGAHERYLMLQQIPLEFGGCKNCRFWHMCKGGCPGEGINDDWRNRTRFCESLKILYEHIERRVRGLLPNVFTLPMFHPECPTPAVIQDGLGENGITWGRGNSIEEAKEKLIQRVKQKAGGHNDAFHGDSPHGDAHGDSDHQDGHGDKHTDSSPHSDTHGDKYEDSRVYLECGVEEHSDKAHSDEHGDGHGDIEHGDKSHGDSSHGDKHSDKHLDSAYNDKSHGDSHGDKHGDINHGDIAHGDR